MHIDSETLDQSQRVTLVYRPQKSAWSRFLVSLVVRNPEAVAAIRERLETAVLDIDPATEREYRRRRLPHEPRTLREGLAHPRNADAVAHRSLDVLRATADNPRIGAHLINMRWGQITLPWDAPALLTSDRPLIWMHGFEHPNCTIMLPLGPKTVFYACNTVARDAFIRNVPAASLAAFLNEAVMRRAVNFVYALSDVHRAYVQQHMGVNPQATMAEVIVSNLLRGAAA